MREKISPSSLHVSFFLLLLLIVSYNSPNLASLSSLYFQPFLFHSNYEIGFKCIKENVPGREFQESHENFFETFKQKVARIELISFPTRPKSMFLLSKAATKDLKLLS